MMFNSDDDFSNEIIRTATTTATTNTLSVGNADYSADCNLKTLHCLILGIKSSLFEVILVDCHSNLNLTLTAK